MNTVGYFINHCDEEDCGLGTFDYNCPNCNKYVSDCDFWWEKDKIYNNEKCDLTCEKCQTDLIVEYKPKNLVLLSLKKPSNDEK